MMASDYCSLCQSHIACNNDGVSLALISSRLFSKADLFNFNFVCTFAQQWGSACSEDAQLVEMTPKIKATILATHNKHRNEIAGGQVSGFDTAAKMSTLVNN